MKPILSKEQIRKLAEESPELLAIKHTSITCKGITYFKIIQFKDLMQFDSMDKCLNFLLDFYEERRKAAEKEDRTWVRVTFRGTGGVIAPVVCQIEFQHPKGVKFEEALKQALMEQKNVSEQEAHLMAHHMVQSKEWIIK